MLIAVFANDKSLAVGVVKKRLKPIIWGLLMDLGIKATHLNGLCFGVFTLLWGCHLLGKLGSANHHPQKAFTALGMPLVFGGFIF